MFSEQCSLQNREINSMKKIISHIVIYSFLCTLFPSCATVAHGTRQKILVETQPSGATVSDGRISVVTPGELWLKRGKNHTLTVTKPGYETKTVQISRVFNGTSLGNIPVGAAIGVATGAVICYGPFILPGLATGAVLGTVAGCGASAVDALSGAQWHLTPDVISTSLQSSSVDEV